MKAYDVRKTLRAAESNLGIESVDKINEKFGVKEIRRVFPDIPKAQRKGPKSLRLEKVNFQNLSLFYKLRFPTNADVFDVVRTLRQNPEIESADPNYLHRMHETIPSEYASRAALAIEQWALDKIKAPEAWDLQTGSPEVVIPSSTVVWT